MRSFAYRVQSARVAFIKPRHLRRPEQGLEPLHERRTAGPGQLVDNIKLYNEHAARFAELMPYNRSWYALRTDGGWLLGPSKYIGYQNLSPEEYLDSPYSAEKRGRMVQHDRSALPLDGYICGDRKRIPLST
jgi:hypothetical protein